VWVDNDATLALLAEARRGAARAASDVVLLTIGTGIGGGIMSGGRLVRGDRGAAGEPGHMTIEADGPPCPGDCPGRGCLEAFVSGPALARMGWPSAADGIAAARAGDEDARVALEQMGGKLGVGFASLMNLLDPEVIVVGGGFGSDAGPLLLEPAERVARSRALEPAASTVRFAVAELGEDAGMLGAAMLAFAGGDA
jgi:glucokinase